MWRLPCKCFNRGSGLNEQSMVRGQHSQQSFRSLLSSKRHFCYQRGAHVVGGCSSSLAAVAAPRKVSSIFVTSSEWWYILNEIKEVCRMERYFSDHVAYRLDRHSSAKPSAAWDLFACISPEKAVLGGRFMQVEVCLSRFRIVFWIDSGYFEYVSLSHLIASIPTAHCMDLKIRPRSFFSAETLWGVHFLALSLFPYSSMSVLKKWEVRKIPGNPFFCKVLRCVFSWGILVCFNHAHSKDLSLPNHELHICGRLVPVFSSARWSWKFGSQWPFLITMIHVRYTW